MKTKIIMLAVLSIANANAGGWWKYSASSYVPFAYTNGATETQVVRVVNPKLTGCPSDWCMGGPTTFVLKPSHSGQKICKELNLGNYVPHSKEIGHGKFKVYSFLSSEIFERHGTPGAEVIEKTYSYIMTLQCEKKGEK